MSFVSGHFLSVVGCTLAIKVACKVTQVCLAQSDQLEKLGAAVYVNVHPVSVLKDFGRE